MNGDWYVPSAILNIPCKILHVTYEKVNGVNTPVETESENVVWMSCKSYGGTEKIIDEQYTIIDTIVFTTYYRPDITAQDRIKILTDGSVWEILNTPENIELRGSFMTFKGRRWHG